MTRTATPKTAKSAPKTAPKTEKSSVSLPFATAPILTLRRPNRGRPGAGDAEFYGDIMARLAEIVSAAKPRKPMTVPANLPPRVRAALHAENDRIAAIDAAIVAAIANGRVTVRTESAE